MKLYFLRGAMGDERLLVEHQDTIDDLLNGNYHNKNLEKLNNYAIYSFRLNQAGRLLFAVEHINGQPIMIVLEHLPTHGYKNSRVLRSGVLKRYLEQHAEEHRALVNNPFDFVPVEREGAFIERDPEHGINFEVLEYYQQMWLELNTDQQDAINVPLPAICNGAPGSGKSCVSLSMLVAFLEKQMATHTEGDPLPAPLLYVAKEPRLVKVMEDAYKELPIAQQYPQGIQFKTYDELINAPEKLVKQQHFNSWYEEYQRIQKIRFPKETPIINQDIAYQELRIASGYSQEDYLALGVQSSILSKEDGSRLWLYNTYKQYTQHLQASDLVNPDFYQFSAEALYSLITVDEAHDCSLRQLFELFQLAINKGIIYFTDNHQRLYDTRTIIPYLKQVCGIKEDKHIYLNTSYRAPLKIVAAANLIVNLKHQLLHGRNDKYENTGIEHADSNKGMGSLHVLTQQQLVTNSWLQEQIGQPYCVIITSKDFINEAKALFPQSMLVMTPQECKGLEYDVVITYKLYSKELFKKAQESLNESGNKKNPQNRPKAGTRDDRFTLMLNAIYTCYMRTKQVLIVCEPSVNDNNLLLKNLLSLSTKEAPSARSLMSAVSGSWEMQVLDHYRWDNINLAKLIFQNKLKQGTASFEAFIQQHLVQNTPVTAEAVPSIGPFASASSPAIASVKLVEENPVASASTSEMRINNETQIQKFIEQTQIVKRDKRSSALRKEDLDFKKLFKTRDDKKFFLRKIKELGVPKFIDGFWAHIKERNDSVQIMLSFIAEFHNLSKADNLLTKLSELVLRHYVQLGKKLVTECIQVESANGEPKKLSLFLLLFSRINPEQIIKSIKGSVLFEQFTDDNNQTTTAFELLVEKHHNAQTETQRLFSTVLMVRPVIHFNSLIANYPHIVYRLLCAQNPLLREVYITAYGAEFKAHLTLELPSGHGTHTCPLLFLIAGSNAGCGLTHALIQAEGINSFLKHVKHILFVPASRTPMEPKVTPFHLFCASKESRWLCWDWATLKKFVTADQLHGTISSFSDLGPLNSFSLFSYICLAPMHVELIRLHWDYFVQNTSAKQLHDKQTQFDATRLNGNSFRFSLNDQVTAGYQVEDEFFSPFELLCRHKEGQSLIRERWDFFRRTIDVNCLYELVTHEDSSKVVREHWDLFQECFTIEQLNSATNSKGSILLHLLCLAPKGREFLSEHFDFFTQQNTWELLSTPIPERDVSAFDLLFITESDQCDFLAKHWERLEPYVLQYKLLDSVEDKCIKGVPLFQLMIDNKSIIALIAKHWEVFRPIFTKSVFHKPNVSGGGLDGMTAFHFFCSMEHTCAFMEERWDFFVGLISPEDFHAPIIQAGPLHGFTPFSRLCRFEQGQKFICNHWDFLEKSIPDRALFEPLIDDGTEEGSYPLKDLYKYPPARTLVYTKKEPLQQSATAINPFRFFALGEDETSCTLGTLRNQISAKSICSPT